MINPSWGPSSRYNWKSSCAGWGVELWPCSAQSRSSWTLRRGWVLDDLWCRCSATPCGWLISSRWDLKELALPHYVPLCLQSWWLQLPLSLHNINTAVLGGPAGAGTPSINRGKLPGSAPWRALALPASSGCVNPPGTALPGALPEPGHGLPPGTVSIRLLPPEEEFSRMALSWLVLAHFVSILLYGFAIAMIETCTLKQKD